MDTSAVSGPGRQLVALARALEPRGIEIRLLLFHRNGPPRSPFEDFVEAAGLPYKVVHDAGRFDPGLAARVRSVLEEWRPDIVQTHAYRPTALAYWLRRRGATWRWVGFHHGVTREDLKVRFYHWLDRRLIVSADQIVVVSAQQATRFTRATTPVRRISNAILPVSSDATVPAMIDRGERDGPVIGVIGRLSHEKGVDVFLQALGHLRRDGLRPRAVIAGDGPERQRLETLTAKLGLHDQVRLLGIVGDVHSLYRQIDLVVLPSRSEGLPNVLLEALHADTPVVATNVGAVAEVLSTPGAGRVVPPESPEALARAIDLSLKEDPDQGRAARARVCDRYTLERRVNAHIDLYREVLTPEGGLRLAGTPVTESVP